MSQPKTDRELLEQIAEKQSIHEMEIGMCLNSIRTLCEVAGAHDAERELAAYIADKRRRLANGGTHDEPTDPQGTSV